MAEIYKGSNGVVFGFTVKGNGIVSDITGATVSVKMKKSDGTFTTKTATVTDAPNGLCQMTLSSSDLDMAGLFFFQAQVTFPDNDTFFSDIFSFMVSQPL